MGVEDTDLLNDSYIQDLSELFDTEITSIAATVGGILAQDILRTISANELPICNWFYLDGKEGK